VSFTLVVDVGIQDSPHQIVHFENCVYAKLPAEIHRLPGIIAEPVNDDPTVIHQLVDGSMRHWMLPGLNQDLPAAIP
jgi:hypothetical protein